jgi:Uma2 family endonuclease
MPLTIELPERDSLTEFNLRRWDELLADPQWHRVPGRIETNRHGQVLANPFASNFHGGIQSDIVQHLARHIAVGRVITECAVSTSDGVKIADVAWVSAERFEKVRPEICVEILSPSNTKREIREKTALYLEAGAKEVWICNSDGMMTFQAANGKSPKHSRLCPNFPTHIPLP